MNTSPALKYSDICLVPKYSTLRSRAEADVSTYIGSNPFRLPVIPANMKTVMTPKIAETLSENDYFYIMHRFDLDVVGFVRVANEKKWKTVSISVGVQANDFEIINTISTTGLKVDYITIDIAHGHCIMMKEMISHIRSKLPDVFIIAGNVATPCSCADLALWGADMIKVGIGQGNVCTTKDKTGFTMSMFTCVQACAKELNGDNKWKSIPIIADGGIECNGDISKAISAGANGVMIGSMFSSCSDSPAVTTTVNGAKYKQYYGSASKHNKGHTRNIEGMMKELLVTEMTYLQKLEEIEQDLQSAVSYAGGESLHDLKTVEYTIIN
jgi:GMP reductase